MLVNKFVYYLKIIIKNFRRGKGGTVRGRKRPCIKNDYFSINFSIY